MTCLEFIASITSSLAWPVVLLIGLLIMKEPLLKALPRLQKVKFKELEAEFDRDLDKIEQDVKAAGLEEVEDTEIVEDLQDRLEQISQISPNAAIVEAFRSVEQSAKTLIKSRNLHPDYKTASPYKLIERVLSQNDFLNKKEISIFRDLRNLRNKITHSDLHASKKQADEYIELAALLIAKIDDAADDNLNH